MQFTVGAPTQGSKGFRVYSVRQPRHAEPVKGYILADTFFGLDTHFTTRTVVCMNRETCQHCKAKLARRWYGYLPMCDETGVKQFIVAFTETIARHFQGITSSGRTLVGPLWTFFRGKGGANARMMVADEYGGLLKSMRPAVHPVVPSVLSMLGFDNETCLEWQAEIEAQMRGTAKKK